MGSWTCCFQSRAKEDTQAAQRVTVREASPLRPVHQRECRGCSGPGLRAPKGHATVAGSLVRVGGTNFWSLPGSSGTVPGCPGECQARGAGQAAWRRRLLKWLLEELLWMGSLLCHPLPAAFPVLTQLFIRERSNKCYFLVSRLLSVFPPLGCKQGRDTLSVSSTTISPEPRTVCDT